MQIFQRTLKKPVDCTGIGLHSGKKVNMRLRPAAPDTGIMFKRTDRPGATLIPGDVFHVVDTNFSTTLGNNGITVSTVEHLMSAMAALGLDNCLVEVDAPEVPVMDGSSAPFVFLIRSAGLVNQSQPRRYYAVKRKISVSNNGKSVSATPSDHLSIDFTIQFDHPAIRKQNLHFDFSEKAYDKEISRARTFGFLEDVHYLQENNLALGGSLDNAVVMDNYQVLNEDGLRYPDEFVRHKILDFLGDLALVGRPIVGNFKAEKSGHQLNNVLFKQFLADPQAWQLITPVPQEAAGIPPRPMAAPAPVEAAVA